MAIVAVYGIQEAEQILDLLEEQNVPCKRIWAPEWIKEKDYMYCNHAVEVKMEAGEVKHLLEQNSVPVRGVFDLATA